MLLVILESCHVTWPIVVSIPCHIAKEVGLQIFSGSLQRSMSVEQDSFTFIYTYIYIYISTSKVHTYTAYFIEGAALKSIVAMRIANQFAPETGNGTK